MSIKFGDCFKLLRPSQNIFCLIHYTNVFTTLFIESDVIMKKGHINLWSQFWDFGHSDMEPKSLLFMDDTVNYKVTKM